jgi:transposase
VTGAFDYDSLRCVSTRIVMPAQSSFLDALLPSGFGRNARLEAIDGLIDWSRIAAIVSVVHSAETGRPPYAPLSMVKALLLQQWYGLSDPGLEEALMDRVSFRRFCGFALDVNAPDETTLCRFRNALKTAGLGDALFAEINRQLEAGNFMVTAGTLIDATLMASQECATTDLKPTHSTSIWSSSLTTTDRPQGVRSDHHQTPKDQPYRKKPTSKHRAVGRGQFCRDLVYGEGDRTKPYSVFQHWLAIGTARCGGGVSLQPVPSPPFPTCRSFPSGTGRR